MTDEKMSIQIGRRMFNREREIAALEQYLSTLKGPDGKPLAWESPVAQYRHKLAEAQPEQDRELRRAIAAGSENLVQALHDFL